MVLARTSDGTVVGQGATEKRGFAGLVSMGTGGRSGHRPRLAASDAKAARVSQA